MVRMRCLIACVNMRELIAYVKMRGLIACVVRRGDRERDKEVTHQMGVANELIGSIIGKHTVPVLFSYEFYLSAIY